MLIKTANYPTVIFRPPPSSSLVVKSCRRQRQIKKKNWHGTEACWRWRHLQRITTSMTALHGEPRRLVVLCFDCVSCALCAVPRAEKRVLLSCAAPRRVSSPDHAVFPPHRTFEVWAKWHAVYCWRVLELRSPRTVPTGWFVEREIIMPSSNTECRTRSTEHCTRPSLYTESKYLRLSAAPAAAN